MLTKSVYLQKCHCFFISKLNIPLEHSDEFWVDCLRFIEKMPRSTEKKCLVELETNILEFLYVKEMFNMYWSPIFSVYGGYLYYWSNLNIRGVRGGHCWEFYGSEIGFCSQRRRWSVSKVKWEWYQESWSIRVYYGL